MTTTFEGPVLLTVRGTLVPSSLEAARVLHNDTAGSEQGIAAARSLGDLSHKVYAPADGLDAISMAKKGELLFLDNWMDPKGIMEFFANAHVQQQGSKLFASREPAVWMAARGAFMFHLPPAAGQSGRFIGVIRATISNPEATIEAFRTVVAGRLRDARKRGQLSHELFIRMRPPGESGPLEVLGIDVWTNAAGLAEHYSDRSSMGPIAATFAGAPEATVWEQAPGSWSEW